MQLRPERRRLGGVWRDQRPWKRRREAPLSREATILDEKPLAQIDIYDSVVILTRRKARGVWTSYPIDPGALAQALGKLPLSTGLLPAGTLATGLKEGAQFYVLHIPPRSVRMQVDMAGRREVYAIRTPPLIWCGCGQDYRIWALGTESATLQGDEKLYCAPFANVWATGGICWGSVRRVEASASSLLAQLKTFLEESEFNAHLVQDRSRQYPNNILLRYADLSPDQPYPLDDLVEAGRRLRDVLYGRWSSDG
ncbi:MAG TPA: hypothetical protein VFS21_37240 [Roseiflexaceae bacterium]|nr:hypothetical protein [Roseiflexaceae bacterium]